jgi:hypothetical protein
MEMPIEVRVTPSLHRILFKGYAKCDACDAFGTIEEMPFRANDLRFCDDWCADVYELSQSHKAARTLALDAYDKAQDEDDTVGMEAAKAAYLDATIPMIDR